MEKLTYKEIKNEYGAKYGRKSVFIDIYTCALSPIFTKIALRFNLIPNTVTIGMIISGILASLIFWIPNEYIRIIGIIFIHMWYILDCSDGEVARITKRYSKYGEELDYMAHAINHPFFLLSFLIAAKMDGVCNTFILIAFFCLLSSDVVIRMVYTFNHIDNIRFGSKGKQETDKGGFTNKEIIIFIVNIFAQFPNFALIYPIIYLINKNFAIVYLFINLFIAVLYTAYVAVSWIMRIYKQ